MDKNGVEDNNVDGPFLFGPEELSGIGKYGDTIRFSPGEMLFKEGEEGSALFFIVEGSVQTFRTNKDLQEEIISIKGPGELLGEISLSGAGERFSTAQSLENVTAVKMEQKDFLSLTGDKPQILLKIMCHLSQELRDADLYRIRLLEKKNEQILRSYDDLKNAQDELMKRERLAAVGNLASKIIHDIKGTITPLKVYSENLDSLTDEARRFGLITIRLSINRIMRICEELLEYVRGVPLSLRKSTIGIHDFIKKEVDFLTGVICVNNIGINTEYEYDGTIIVDDERMGRVMQNLLLNARDAMPNGGTITIRTSSKDSFVVIAVSDTGCGIGEDIRERIFYPFVSMGKKKGTGLGLTISKKIMEEHGGRIDVESEPGKGATFILSIPLRQDG